MMARKRILSWLVAASLALSLLPTAALAYNGDEFLEKTTQSITDAENTEADAEAAKTAAETAKADAAAAETAANADSLVGKASAAEDAYQDALTAAQETGEDGKSAIDKVNEANAAIKGTEATEDTEATKGIEGKTNDAVAELNQTAGDALAHAQETIKNATDEDGKFTDVKAAETAAAAAAEAAKAAQEVFDTEDATDEQKRKAANTAKEAAATANQAVETAQATLDAAQADVDTAKAAYEQVQQDYASLINIATGEVAEIQNENSAANELVKAANQALATAKAALEAAEAKKDGAQSAAEAAKAAAQAAQTAANNATNALNTANAANISEKLGVENITGMDDEAINTAKDSADEDALTAFKTAYKAADNHLIESLADKAFEELKNLEISTSELIELQTELNNAWRDREEGKFGASLAYDLVYTKIAFKLSLDLRDQTDANRHPTILAIFQAKTAYEVAKENNAKYAEAAKAVVAAQDAKKIADAAKANADQALEDYEAAKAALNNAQALAELQNAKFNELNDLQADLTAAQAKLTAAQLELNEANQKAEDADKAAQDILDQLPPEDDNDDTTITDPTTPGTGDTDDTDTDDDDGATILDDAVPLALMPTRGELMNYLYVRAGSPEAAPATFTDVPADHEFAQAIGWAQANGIAVAYEDGTFDPDNFVIAADMVTFLESYAKVAGMTVTFPLAAMAGLEDDEIVGNADDILSEFFGD